jgi:hypothetical protein
MPKCLQVKGRHASDPRYEAVNSSSLRESLFKKHLESLSSTGAPSKADKAARAAASLREREEQVRAEKERLARSANMARGALGREESEREFRTLLIDNVREHEVCFFPKTLRRRDYLQRKTSGAMGRSPPLDRERCPLQELNSERARTT